MDDYFLEKTCLAKRRSMATLIKAVFYVEVGSVALFFVQIPKLLFIDYIKNINCICFLSHLKKILKNLRSILKFCLKDPNFWHDSDDL